MGLRNKISGGDGGKSTCSMEILTLLVEIKDLVRKKKTHTMYLRNL